ncbi:glutathione S-transferase [Salinihabitans flavidus]|uniref:Glutathione S-transferase n=1 Tax=Salinihabitans flavidus TaxID=569882 RepID=A0A1H8NB08_9RHOB|nr:glutathione S-transferase [Salinihabitans flavidus]SEO26757.1 glutathione S-transferase [Salinihabitans flavidus]
MEIRLHHVDESRSVRVLWLLEELEVDFELVSYDFFDKSLRTAEYLMLNPAGRVPALEIDGAVMCESGAMIEYLCELFPEAGLGRPPGDPERMEWLDWLHYAETIGQHCANLTQAHVVLYEPWMRSSTQMSLEARRLSKVLERIELLLVDGREYLMETGFSGVDCAVGYGVDLARRFVRLDELPGVAEYLERLCARPAFQAAQPEADARRIYAQDFYEVPDA